MNFLKRYSFLALTVLSVEVLLLFLFRTPLRDAPRVPRTFEELVYSDNLSTAAILLPNIFATLTEPEMVSKKPAVTAPSTFLEKKLIAFGLVNIKDLDSTILVSLKYATSDNFLHRNLYGELKNCYLQKDVALKLVSAQKLLKEKYPFYSLIVYDGVRPLSIQQKMWDELKVPEKMKDKYVSNPEVGSLHNFGCAVDLSIVNEDGWEVDMGTPYDYFGELGHPVAEPRMIEEGKLSWRQFENRKLLREVMTESGFTGITTEWWHFNGSSLKIAGEKYHLVD